MKTFNYLLFLSTMIVLLTTSCTKDECRQEVTYTKYTAIYETYENIRADIRNEAPRALENPGKIYFYQNHIFINEYLKGIHIIENSDPENPTPLSFIPILGNVDMAIKNDQLMVDNYTDLLTLDISDLNQVRLTNRQEDVFSLGEDETGIIVGYDQEEVTEDVDCDWDGRNGGFFFEDRFLASGETFDGANSGPAAGATSGNAPSTGIAGSFARFTLYEDYLYIAQNWNLRVFDITDPSAPAEGTTVNARTNSETAYVYRDHLFIGGTTGMNIFDLSNPATPNYISGYNHMLGCDPVAISGDYAYVTIHQGTTCRGELDQLDVLDISDIFNPVLKVSFQMDSPHGLAVTPEALYLCEGDFGLKIFDNNEPLNVGDNLLFHYDNFEAYDVIYLPGQEDILLLIGADGFYQFDVSNPLQPREISHIPVIKS